MLAAACGPKSSGNTADPCKDPCKDQVEGEPEAMTCAAMGDRIACMAAASSPDAAEACASAMTDEQRQSLHRAMEATEEME